MEASRSTRVTLFILLVLINCNQENVFCTSQSTTGRLIFEENFNSKDLDKLKWSKEIRIPLDPDYEFCVYHRDYENIEINNDILKIKPRLLEDSYGEDSIYVGHLRLAELCKMPKCNNSGNIVWDFSCSSYIPQECSHRATSYQILPPVISAKLSTRNHFEFRYGVIEVRAKFPEGDWLYPEIRLEPLYKSYDSKYANARIDLGRARGNSILTRPGNANVDFGGRFLEFGIGNGTGANFHEELVTKIKQGNTWTKDFHTYKTTWTSTGFTFHVDGQLVGKLVPTASGWSRNEYDSPQSMTPFDDKFYLSIGLGVGGVRVFPDNIQTSSYVKPWKNLNAKAMLLFWQAKNSWLPSWQRNQGNNTALEIDYIRVWSLN